EFRRVLFRSAHEGQRDQIFAKGAGSERRDQLVRRGRNAEDRPEGEDEQKGANADPRGDRAFRSSSQFALPVQHGPPPVALIPVVAQVAAIRPRLEGEKRQCSAAWGSSRPSDSLLSRPDRARRPPTPLPAYR